MLLLRKIDMSKDVMPDLTRDLQVIRHPELINNTGFRVALRLHGMTKAKLRPNLCARNDKHCCQGNNISKYAKNT